MLVSEAALQRYNASYMESRLAEIFRRLDCDGDGRINNRDLEQYLEFLGYTAKPNEVSDMVWELDVEGVGSISFEAFRSMRQRVMADQTGNEPRLLYNLVEFMTFDSDGSGSIEEEEVRRIFFFHHEQRGSMLDQCMNEFFSILKEFRMASNPDAEEQGKLSEEITYSEYLLIMTEMASRISQLTGENARAEPQSQKPRTFHNPIGGIPPCPFAVSTTATQVLPNLATPEPTSPRTRRIKRYRPVRKQAQPETRPLGGKQLAALTARSPKHIARMVPVDWWLTSSLASEVQTARPHYRTLAQTQAAATRMSEGLMPRAPLPSLHQTSEFLRVGIPTVPEGDGFMASPPSRALHYMHRRPFSRDINCKAIARRVKHIYAKR